MKQSIKMFGLVALAALVGMEFAGIGSTMAESTALCEEDESPCTEPVTYVHLTTLAGQKEIKLRRRLCSH
jgi:hypothetical protein